MRRDRPGHPGIEIRRYRAIYLIRRVPDAVEDLPAASHKRRSRQLLQFVAPPDVTAPDRYDRGYSLLSQVVCHDVGLVGIRRHEPVDVVARNRKRRRRAHGADQDEPVLVCIRPDRLKLGAGAGPDDDPDVLPSSAWSFASAVAGSAFVSSMMIPTRRSDPIEAK